MEICSRTRWTVCQVIHFLAPFYNRLTREWQKEYLHPLLHIFSRCQETIPRWANFVKSEYITFHINEIKNRNITLEHRGRNKPEGLDVFCRMLIATAEYSDDEHSPVFDLMYLLLACIYLQQVPTFEENVLRHNNMGVLEGIVHTDVSSRFFRGNLQN